MSGRNAFEAVELAPHNNRVQRAALDKLLGGGRLDAAPVQVMRARVQNELRPVADAEH
jgi:hypothetical protein